MRLFGSIWLRPNAATLKELGWDGHRKGHRGKMLVMRYSHIILVTKQSRIDSFLDDGVTIWIVATIPSFLLTEWKSVSFKPAFCGSVPNGIHEIHVLQQHLSESDIETYTVMCLTRVEVI